MDSTSRLAVTTAAFVSGAVMVGAMWLPWFTSGSAGRNSFAMFRAAQILGIETITPFRVVWFLLPVLLLAVGALYVFGLTRAASVALALLGAIFVILGIVALSALGTHAGSAAATVAGLCTIVLAIPGMLKPAT
ncbi:MAG: hypothetical protein ACR2QO_13220 [Acidimicrobiales bacterium]